MPTMPRGEKNPLHYGLAQRLMDARAAAEYPGTHLSRDAGLSHATVFAIEAGQVPRVDVVEVLALVLGMSPCWLAFGVPLASTAMAPQAPGIGERLRAAREGRGLALRALARAAKMTPTGIAYIESGRTVPSVATAEQLARQLDVSPCWLAFGEGSPDGPKVPPPVKKKKPAPAPRQARKPAGSSRRKPAARRAARPKTTRAK